MQVELTELILDILLNNVTSGTSDKRVWCNSVHGDVTAKLAYHRLRLSFLQVKWGHWIWAPFIPPRRSFVVWRAIYGHLPILNVLLYQGFIGASVCPFCLRDEESIDHIFTSCSYALFLWQRLFDAFQVHLDCTTGFLSLIIQATDVTLSPQLLSLFRSAFMTSFG